MLRVCCCDSTAAAAIDRRRPWTLASQQTDQPTAQLLLLAVCGVSSSDIPIHYADEAQTEREAQ